MSSWKVLAAVVLLAACSSSSPSRTRPTAAPDGAPASRAAGGSKLAPPTVTTAAPGAVPQRPAAANAAAPAGGAAPPDGAQRLPRTVVPRRYALDMIVDPAASGFSGSVLIEVDLTRSSREILLHAEGLEFVGDVVVRTADAALVATRTAGPHGGLRLTLPVEVPAGPASIECRYTAPYGDGAVGVYRFADGGDAYVFTQFESIYARRAFPCFDEPGFKAAFDVTLRVPHRLVALANAPEAGRTTEGDLDVVRFERTPPLPAYVVAWTAGPWDVVAAPEGACRVPLRVVAAKGRGRLAAWTLGRTPGILAELEDWFGEPYPFGKLDLVAVPKFDWGGMENAGLVAFREDLVLLDGSDVPVRDRLSAEETIAHELAHMWFGDMVTPAWWDDLWLNEAFATWMAAKVLDRVDPGLDAGLASLARAASVMRLDSRPDARAVRQPIGDPGDVFNAFDDITYGKGSRLLVMTEAWLSPREFRRGVRDYIDAHRWGSATSGDLFDALENATGKPVGSVLAGYLDRPGVPCLRSQGSSRTGKVDTRFLVQSRWAPQGGALPPAAPWTIPVTVFQSWNTEYRPRSSVLSGRETSLELWSGDGGPVSLNADGAGWYLIVPSVGELRSVVDDTKHVSRADRVAAATQIPLLRDSGDLSGAEALDLTLALAADGDRFTVGAACDLFRELDRLAVDDAVRPAFQRLVRESLAPHLARVGLAPRAGEPDSARLLRADLTLTLGTAGADEKVRAHCLATAEAFLADPGRAPREPLRAALAVAASGGDAKLWQSLRAALDRPLPPDLRRRVVAALGGFEDPDLAERSCALLLDGTARPSEDLWSLAGAPGWSGLSADAVRARWRWVAAHYDALRRACGDESAAWFPSFAERLRTRTDRDAVAAFFAALPAPPAGTARNLALALAEIDENERRGGLLLSGLSEFLARPR